MLKLYIIGLSILLTAILANFLASILELKSWYDFLTIISEEGGAGFKQVSFFDYVWLIFIYPLTLGLGYWLGNKLFHLVFYKKS